MSVNLQTQKIRLKVTLKKITMNIKFPCSLTAQIKHDTSLDSRKLFELKSGECLMGQTFESECEVQYHPARLKYEEKKVSINVFMVSMSGKVASGTVTFSIFAKEAGQVSECVQFLEKCPDKQAKIYFSFSFEVLRKSERLDKTFFSEFREEHNKKKQSFNSVFLDKTLRTPKAEQRQIQQKKNKRSPSPINNALNESIVQGVISLDRNSFKNQHKTERRNTEYSLMQQLKAPLTSKGRGVSKNTIRQNLSNKSFNLQQQMYTERFQTQPVELQQNQQLEKLRMKVRNLQRSDKGAAQMLRETKQQGQRRKNKITQLEATKFELQEALRMKDEKIKRLDKTLKQTSQQKEDFENQYKSIKTQLEIRQNVNKQQLKKWEDKYKQSEAQREQITEEYNRALKTFEEGEKKYQVLLKQKERAALQEKARTNKKLEQQTISHQVLEKQNRQLKIQLQDLTKEKKQLFDAYSGSEVIISNTNLTIQSLQAKLKSEGERIHKLQDQIELLKASEAEKQQLKKKMQQLTLNNSLLSQKLQKSSKTIEGLQSKVKYVEEQSQKRSTQKHQLSTSLNQLKKNYQNIKISQQQKIKQLSSLSSMHEIANSKINELKSKLEFEKRTQEQSQRQFTTRYNMIVREKQSLIAEGEEIRWELEKQLANVNELSMQLRVLNDEIFRLNEELLEKGEKIKQIQQNYKQMTISYQHVNNNFIEGQKKKRQLQGYCKDRDNEYVQLKKRAQRAEREVVDLKERVRLIESSTKQKGAQLQRKLKEKQESLQVKSSQIQSIEIQLRSWQDESNTLKHQLQASIQELSHLKDIIASNRRELQSQETMILKLKESDSQSKKGISQRQSQLLRCSSALQACSKKIQKMNEEYTLSRGNCTSTLQNFLNDLIRDEESGISGNQSLRNRNGLYPDQKIAALQIEYLQKHWQHASKQRTKIIQLSQEKEVLQYEISRLKINLEEHSQKNQHDIINQRQRIKALYVEVSKKQQYQKQTIHRYEAELNLKDRQLEQTRSKVGKHEDEVVELQAQIKIVLGQYDSLKEENRELEQQILKAKSQQIKQRAEWQTKTKEATDLLQDQITHLRQSQLELQRKIASLEKDQTDKAQLLKKYQLEMNVLIYERDKKESRANELSYRVEEYQADLKDTEKQIRQKDRELKKTHQAVEQLNSRLREEKEKLQEALFKVQQQNNIIVQLYKEIEKSKQDLKKQQEKFIEIETINRNKMETLRLLTEKQVQEIKQLKEKQITISSELQLKKFMMVQLENAQKTERSSREQLKIQLEKKKSLAAQLTEENAVLLLKIKQIEEQQSTIASEKEAMTVAVQRLKISINHMRASARQEHQTSDQVVRLEREIEKIKQEKNDESQLYQRTIQELKNSLREAKKSESSKQWREQQLKKKLKTVQKLLDSTNPDLALEKTRIFKELQRQKRDLISRNEILQSRVDHLEDQLASFKLRAKRQVDKYSHQIQSIKEEMNAKDFIIRNQQIQIDNVSIRLNEIFNEKSRVQAELQRQRNRNKKLQTDLQNQHKATRQKLKKAQDQQIKNVMGEIEKRLESSRSKRLEGNFDELQRVILSGSYRQLQQIIRGIAKQRKS